MQQAEQANSTGHRSAAPGIYGTHSSAPVMIATISDALMREDETAGKLCDVEGMISMAALAVETIHGWCGLDRPTRTALQHLKSQLYMIQEKVEAVRVEFDQHNEVALKGIVALEKAA